MYTALLSFCISSGYLLWAICLVGEAYYSNHTRWMKRKYIDQITIVFILNAIAHAVYMLIL